MADMGFLPPCAACWTRPHPSARCSCSRPPSAPRSNRSSPGTARPGPPRRHCRRIECGRGLPRLLAAQRENRVGLTARLVTEHGRAVVFCRTKRGADRVARQLHAAGVDAVAIHATHPVPARARPVGVLVRQGVRAGGDRRRRPWHPRRRPALRRALRPPNDPTDYVHRSGRTGRAGNTGTVVSLVTDESTGIVRGLQRSLGLPQGLDAPDGPSTAMTTTALSAEDVGRGNGGGGGGGGGQRRPGANSGRNRRKSAPGGHRGTQGARAGAPGARRTGRPPAAKRSR